MLKITARPEGLSLLWKNNVTLREIDMKKIAFTLLALLFLNIAVCLQAEETNPLDGMLGSYKG
jgi:hypothetical protein